MIQSAINKYTLPCLQLLLRHSHPLYTLLYSLLFFHICRATWGTLSRWLTTSCKPSLTLGYARLRFWLYPQSSGGPQQSHLHPITQQLTSRSLHHIICFCLMRSGWSFSFFLQQTYLPPDSTRDKDIVWPTLNYSITQEQGSFAKLVTLERLHHPPI